MPLPAAVIGFAVLCCVLWCCVTVARIRDIPRWRRFLPFTLFLISTGVSLLRALNTPQVAELIAFPLNLAVITLALREISQRRKRRAAAATC